jgi:hypothetical protein
VEDDVFEEADFDAKGDDLAELCDEAELLAAGAAVGEGEVGGAGGFDSGGEVGGVEVEDGAELHGSGELVLRSRTLDVERLHGIGRPRGLKLPC